MIYIRMTLACFIFTLFGGIVYFRNRKLPLKTTKIFISIFATTLLYLVCDACTTYTVNHLEIIDGKLVDTALNYTLHIFYLILLSALIYLFYVYISYHTDTKKKRNWKTISMGLSMFMVSSIFIIFLPVDYVISELNYAVGPKVYAFYVSFAFYVIVIFIKIILGWKNINSNKLFSIILSLICFGIISIVQIIFPAALVPAIWGGLFIISVVLSGENAEKYTDDLTGFFNNSVFELVLSDWIKYKRSFLILTISIENYIYTNRLKNEDTAILQEIGKGIDKKFNIYCYVNYGDSFSVLLLNSLRCDEILSYIRETLVKYSHNSDVDINYNIMEVTPDSTVESIEESINDFLTKIEYLNTSVDALTTARNRNAYERELVLFNDGNPNKFLILFDMNDLKKINDTYGHAFGDSALKLFSRTINECFYNTNLFYRIGGDEFVVLYMGDINGIEVILNKIRVDLDRVNELPFKITFACGYSSLQDENAYVMADKNMYVNKQKVKGTVQ